ncbi:hypothetical protein CAPTEDRAFT_213290 [Capitella teleta]|uniref:C-type lectin domain-containing protein n=1 Tax=Capitella teleta TaxID=283909 RepID=R7UQJ7_CAPTE|nr:hypothetical protein CAPTEDRAFT_213290 [Capitella teleta]|eukprot:ELU08383.1 hypothetical protein CAPTEDRAFT_213290 [Capitella teleta]
MKIVFTLALSACVALGVFGDPRTCDLTWKSVNGVAKSCYKVHRVTTTWPLANDACESEGMHLIAMETEDELELIARYMANIVSPLEIPWWTAGKGEGNDKNTWAWAPGNTPISHGWNPGKPDTGNHTTYGRVDKCVALVDRGFSEYSCYSHRQFLCEQDL